MSHWLYLPLAFALACGGETAGEIVAIDIALESAADEERALGAFETDTGYTVELEAASVRLGPIFAFAPEPIARRARVKPLFELVSDALVPVARAHGGVDLVSGRIVRAEWLEPVTLDLLEPDLVVLGTVDAEAGAVDAITVEIARAGQGGPQLHVRGTATRAGEAIAFEGELGLDDDPLERRIELVRQDIALTQGGRLTLRVHPSAWLRDVEFSRAPPGDAGTAILTSNSQPGRALQIGARSPDAFSIDWEP
jgi:hypothetical protein